MEGQALEAASSSRQTLTSWVKTGRSPRFLALGRVGVAQRLGAVGLGLGARQQLRDAAIAVVMEARHLGLAGSRAGAVGSGGGIGGEGGGGHGRRIRHGRPGDQQDGPRQPDSVPALSAAPLALPPGARGRPGLGLEHPGEVAAVAEADFERDVGDLAVGRRQQLLGAPEAQLEQEVPGRHAAMALEHLGEVVRAEQGLVGDGAQREVLAEVLLHVGGRRRHRLGLRRAADARPGGMLAAPGARQQHQQVQELGARGDAEALEALLELAAGALQAGEHALALVHPEMDLGHGPALVAEQRLDEEEFGEARDGAQGVGLRAEHPGLEEDVPHHQVARLDVGVALARGDQEAVAGQQGEAARRAARAVERDIVLGAAALDIDHLLELVSMVGDVPVHQVPRHVQRQLGILERVDGAQALEHARHPTTPARVGQDAVLFGRRGEWNG